MTSITAARNTGSTTRRPEPASATKPAALTQHPEPPTLVGMVLGAGFLFLVRGC
ncbi:MAG: PEP-CTERM sorting domain-containing protein [Vicinamibacterales bacterium]